MNFEQFQNQSRLYVIGALEEEELEEFERARKNSEKRRKFHHQMLRLARSVRPEPASGEVLRRNQGPAHGHGKGQERNLIRAARRCEIIRSIRCSCSGRRAACIQMNFAADTAAATDAKRASALQLPQDKFLQKSVEIHLEQTQVSARTDR